MPAPVSAITRGLPMRRASSAWPMVLLILCAPKWPRSSGRSYIRITDLGDESGHFSGVLDAFRRLDTTGHIDAPGVHPADRFAHVARVQAAGEDERLRDVARRERPVEALADAAVLGHEAVEQPCRGARIALQIGERIHAWAHPASFDVRQAELRAELRRLVAMELEHRGMHPADDLRDLRAVGVDEERDRLQERRQRVADLDRALYRYVARARRIEHEADGIRARLRRRARILGARDAADLDARPHEALILVTAIWRRTRRAPDTALRAQTWAPPLPGRVTREPPQPSRAAACRRRRTPGCRRCCAPCDAEKRSRG